jgi:uncharacterized lipoprotein YmbA
MTRRLVKMAAAWTLAALCAACASSPAHFYTLSPTVAAASGSEASASKPVVVVGPVSIPAIVDMPQIVVSKGANQVDPDQFNLWASPLRNNISQVVCANLGALLGTSSVSSVLRVDADYRVEIDVQVFESVPGDAATLSAMWSVRRVKDGVTSLGHTQIREASPEKGYQALAAAHSKALSQLSTDIAEKIRVLDHAGT